MSSQEARLLVLAILLVIAVYLIARRLRGGVKRRAPAVAPGPLATVRQLGRAGDVDALRHFLTAKSSSEEVRKGALDELTRLAGTPVGAAARRANLALAGALASVPADQTAAIIDRVVADARKAESSTLAWLCAGPSLQKDGPLALALNAVRREPQTPAAGRVAISAALVGCGVLGARGGTFLAAYRRQIDVETDDEEDGMGGTALFSDPFDEPCAVVSPPSLAEEVLVSTTGRVLLRHKIVDERISEATATTPARIERRWEIVPVPAERLVDLLGQCATAIDAVISEEPS